MLPVFFKNGPAMDKTLFDNSPILIVYLDNKGNITQINNRVKDWLKRRPKDLLRKNIFDLPLFPPQTRKKLKQTFIKRLGGEEIPPYDLELLAGDGTIEIGRVTGAVLRDKKGKPMGSLIMVANVTELESELKKNEEKFHNIFNFANDSIFLMNESVFVDCNQKTLRMFGCTKKSDIVGHSPWEFSPPKQPDDRPSRAKAKEYINLALEGDNQRFYWKHIKKDGTPFDAEVSLNKVTVGDETYIQALVRDISKRIEVEKALEKSELMYRSLFDNSNDAVFIANAKTREIIDVNKEATVLMGYSKSELLKMKADDLHPREVREETMEGFKKQAEGKKILVETLVLTQNKKKIPVTINTSTAIIGDNHYLLGSFRDISMLKESQVALEESEERFRVIVENAQPIIFMIDQQGKFVLSEGEQLELLGLKPKEVVGKSALKIYKDFPKIIEGINSALEGKYNRQKINVGEIFFDIFFSPYKVAGGKAEYVIGMAVDISKSERYKQRLVELDKEKTEFISIASHQLRSPLGAIRWGLEALMIREEVKSNPILEKSLETIYKSTLRVINLVNDLLNVSRIEQGRIKDILKKTSVVEIINKSLEELEKIRESLGVTIIFNRPQSDVNATVYPELLREVIQNLINNALRFNESGGVVIIDLEADRDTFTFKIANSGYTIPADEHDKVFRKFFRSRNVANEVSGTGLGLFVSKSFVDQWGGEISFESPATFGETSTTGTKQKGTRFKVVLPRNFSTAKQNLEE